MHGLKAARLGFSQGVGVFSPRVFVSIIFTKVWYVSGAGDEGKVDRAESTTSSGGSALQRTSRTTWAEGQAMSLLARTGVVGGAKRYA